MNTSLLSVPWINLELEPLLQPFDAFFGQNNLDQIDVQHFRACPLGPELHPAEDFQHIVQEMDQKNITAKVKKMIKRIKNHTDLPICSGFGIKSPEDAIGIQPPPDGIEVQYTQASIVHSSPKSQSL